MMQQHPYPHMKRKQHPYPHMKMENILQNKINTYSNDSRQYIFNTLSNTKINELVGQNMLNSKEHF